MHRRFHVLAACVAFWCAVPAISFAGGGASAVASPGAAWTLQYGDKSTNEFIWDKRTQKLVRGTVPASLAGKVLDALGGPPGPVVVVDDRYVSVSACVPHDCLDKGFFWVDTRTGVGLGATAAMRYRKADPALPNDGNTTLLLASNSMDAQHIPPAARQALIDWLSDNEMRTVSVDFIHGRSEPFALDDAGFTARERFFPPPEGPSFDCQRAGSAIEQTICADPALAAQDLALQTLYDRVRRGHGTMAARREVQALQRQWLSQRDKGCTAAAGMSACLQAAYAAQTRVLNHWVPAPSPKR
jgi:uncharacterized protein YecT (DUF1311 family)